jgi:hypothetical protein
LLLGSHRFHRIAFVGNRLLLLSLHTARWVECAPRPLQWTIAYCKARNQMRQNVRQVGQDQPRSAAASSLINGVNELTPLRSSSPLPPPVSNQFRATTRRPVWGFRNHDTKFRRQSGHVFVRMYQIHQCRRDGTQKAIGRIDGTSNHSEGLFGTRRFASHTCGTFIPGNLARNTTTDSSGTPR